MGRGFGKGKYKKIIKSIYPLTPDGDIQVHNIGKLVHFCQISPTKLIKVAVYVERKTNSDLTKSKLRFVGASMKIFQDVIKGCRKNLNLFSSSVLRLIKLLLECSFPELKMIAAETFIQFTEVLDENTPYPELEGLVSYLLDMCQNQIRNVQVRTRLKQDGLRSIRSYIRVLEMTDELDGFIARHTDEDNWAVLLPAILDNLGSPGGPNSDPSVIDSPATTPTIASPNLHVPVARTISVATTLSEMDENSSETGMQAQYASPDQDRESVHYIATELLRDIFSRANISITSLFKAILRYLEVRQRWIPNTFAVYIIHSIYDCLKVQHSQILITLLLQHAELSNHTVGVTAQIFITTIQFFTEATGYFMQILDAVVKQLVSSVEFTSHDQQAAENDNAHLAFQDEMIACLGVLCGKISHQQKLDAFSALCTRLSVSKHVSSSGLSGVVVIFARAILQVTLSTQNFPIDLLIPYLRLFQELSMHNNNDVRIFVQKIFQSILLPSPLSNFAKSNVLVEDPIPEQVAMTIRGTLYFQIKMRMKYAGNYIALYETLRAMLYKCGKFDLLESFPLVFSMQKFATKWKKIPPIRAYTIHTLIAAYLYCVAHLFHCKELETLVDEVMQERAKKGQVCSLVTLQKYPIPDLSIASAAEYSLALQKKVAVEYVLFDRQNVVDTLFSGSNSSIAGEKRFSKLLMKKFRHQSDTLTLRTEALVTAESSYLPSPTAISAKAASPITEHETQESVVFSPQQTNPIEDDSEQLRATRIDVASMKRALVAGMPHHALKPASYADIISSCNQKIINSKQLLQHIASYEQAGPRAQAGSISVFHLDLYL